ncbi:hypothetical protein [Phaeobacter inhibens]|uniref:hypothetical protein n=1 Tax=Phaeobacter inhibens TaxID=221822 RepID=UPI00076BBBBD|nr:hypothetical protein [Phaeobacter inhibens]KXF92661.1 hypothetical protein AT574_00895 [Phaeobacter inhibens]KXF92703.1 hypothetical protein AT574_01135 [Phaeobacter inhibens]WHP70816.1 hypothetical protein QMZ01_21040 [Phaeobacter inhibens]
MNKVTHESLTQGPPAPVAPTAASIGAAALAAQDRRAADLATGSTTDTTRNTGKDKSAAGSDTAADPASDIEMESTTDQTTQNTDKPRPDGDPAHAEATSEAATHRLAPADLDQLAAHLRGGPQPLAGRGDLIELHKRITAMFATLNDGLGEIYTRKAEADRKALSARIDTLEEAVNRMEGALRIELEPVLRNSFARVLADSSAHRRSLRQRLARGLGQGGYLALILAFGLAAGTLYHSRISAAADTAWSAAQIHWASLVRFVETTREDPGQ